MTPDIEYAQKCYSSVMGYDQRFEKYSAAYTVTNENLRSAFKFMPKTAQNVLTVAGSGDHPMFASLYGAKNIDAFDITYNAKCVMDIKTTALHALNYDKYCEFISNLYDCVDASTLSGIFDKLPSEEQNYLNGMRKKTIFNHGNREVNKKNIPTEQEFKKMQECINSSFNFIWSDISSVHHHLNKQYDFIHLSNIFDHLDQDTQIMVLCNMTRFVRPNGVIYFISNNGAMSSASNGWSIKNLGIVHVLQRVR